MLFNSFSYFLFFACVVICYYLIRHKWRWILLLLASYSFYGFWNVYFLLLIFFSTLVDYFAGLEMAKRPDKRERRKYLYLSLFVNLGLLGLFKYLDFTLGTFNTLAAWFGSDYQLPIAGWILPVGISFYTFQTLGYTIDVYRGYVQPEKHLGHFALYVAFFPQLVAGPIERAGRLLPQLKAQVEVSYENIRQGAFLILWGLFQKVVVADRLGIFVDRVFDHEGIREGHFILVAAVFFLFQLFCDFAGYSNIAIGSARILGIKLIKNFDSPLVARSMTEFWRRWHISLTSWFKDYVFIPLGGSRSDKLLLYRNIIVVFLLSGLWHGAAWNFVLWGLACGFLVILEKWVNTIWHNKLKVHWQQQLFSTIRVAYLLTLASGIFVFFRANSVDLALELLSKLSTLEIQKFELGMFQKKIHHYDGQTEFVIACVLIAVVWIMQWATKNRELDEWINSKPNWIRWAIYIGLAGSIVLFGIKGYQPFHYFQF